MPNVLDTDRFFKAADDAVAGDTSSSSTATDDEASDVRLRGPTSIHKNQQHDHNDDRIHAHHHNTDVTHSDVDDDDDDDEGAPMPSFLGSESALELRCKVPPCFAVSRDVGLRWFEAARMGDMRTVKQLLQTRTTMADGAAQTERARLLSSRANAQQPKRSPSATDNDVKSGEESEKRDNDIDRVVRETKSHVIRQLLHYNGQGTTYGFIGGTVLHWACANGDLAMATFLLDAGSSANVQNRGGSTPLHAACAHGEPALVALLLARGGDVSIEDCCADTPQDVIPRDPVTRREITPLLKAQAAATELIESARKIVAAKSQSGRAARNSGEEDPNDADFFSTCDDATKMAIEAAWRPALMKTVILATGQVEDVASMPLERSDLVAMTRTALAAFQRHRALAADADTHAQRLHQKARRHAEKMEAAIAARLDETSSSDDDDDHDARTVHLDADQAARQMQPSGEFGEGGEAALEAKRARRREKRLFAEEHAAKQAKDKGNELFQRGDYKAAVQRYTMAIGIIGNDATFYSNRAAAYMKLNLPQRALEDGRKAAALKPEWAKAHHRIGAAAFALGRFEESARAFSYGLGLAPDDATLKEGYAQAFMMAQQDSQPPTVPHPQRHVDAHADDGDDDEYEYESKEGEREEGQEKEGRTDADFDGSYDDDADGFGHEAMVQDTEIRAFIAAEREKLRQMTIRAEAVAERAGMASDDDSDGPLDDHRRHLRGHTMHHPAAAPANEHSDHRPRQSPSNPTAGGRSGPPADGNESDEDDDEPIDDELYARAMQFAQKRLGALAGRLQQEDGESSDGDEEERGPGGASAGRSRGAVDSGFGRRAGPAVADIPIVQRKPWFDCAVCENKTRDSAETTCCGKQLCGTCLKRAATCPFGC